MRRALGLLLTLSACRPGARSPSPDAAPPRRDVPAPLRSACDEVLAEGRRALEAWRRRQRAAVEPGTWDNLATFNQCVESGERLWATVLGAPLGDPRATSLAGRFKLVHVGRDGTRSEAWPAVTDAGDAFVLRAQETSWRQAEEGRSRLAPIALFDYDGDDAPELLARVIDQGPEGAATERVLVWRATSTRVEPFEPAMGLHPVGVEDFDDDGRPDLLTHAELVGVDDARPGETLRGPSLVARSLPGGLFALSSGVALLKNRERCPAPPPPPLLVRGGPDLDAARSAERVACAMLWRVPAAAIESELRRECPTRPNVPPPTCAAALPRLVAMTRVTPLADLRAAVSFEATEEAAEAGVARAWRVVLEGAPVTMAPLALGVIAGECDVIEGDARLGEVASLRCWAGAEGVEVRAMRQGLALVVQRRAMRDGGAVGMFGELRRVALPLGLVVRAGSLRE
jgi:hypothetical protein